MTEREGFPGLQGIGREPVRNSVDRIQGMGPSVPGVGDLPLKQSQGDRLRAPAPVLQASRKRRNVAEVALFSQEPGDFLVRVDPLFQAAEELQEETILVKEGGIALLGFHIPASRGGGPFHPEACGTSFPGPPGPPPLPPGSFSDGQWRKEGSRERIRRKRRRKGFPLRCRPGFGRGRWPGSPPGSSCLSP